MKQLLFLLGVLSLFFSFGQGEANIWYFGGQAGVDFNVAPPVALTNGVLSTSEGCATISDASGNLLFYTDGSNVWTKNHVLMTNGTGLMGHSSSAQSAVVIPKPGSTTNYYIITVPENGAVGMRYSEVDMTLNGGNGEVLPTNKNTLLFAPSSEKVTVVKHANGVYYWIIGRGNSTSKMYYSFLVDCNGVNTNAIQSNVGLTNGENWGYLVGSPDGTKLASASSGSGVEITDFNPTTGVVSNPINLGTLSYGGHTGGNYGVAFSPNSNVLYATSITNWALVQWDLTAANIPSTETFIGYAAGNGASRPSYRGGALQLASDGKIYVAETGLSSLGVINNPNVLGAGCNFALSQVGLAGRLCRLGLPPFITSFFVEESDITYINDCVSDFILFDISGGSALDSVKWNFGEPASPSNESTLLNPSHKYSSSGNYNVTLIRYIACVEDTIIRNVTIHDYKRYTKNISLCEGELYTLPGGTVINQTGTYIDTLSTTYFPACDSIVTTIVTAPDVALEVFNDTSVCIGNSVQLYADGGVEYEWDADPTLSATNISNPVATPLSTTTYTVRTKVEIGDNLIVNGDFESGNTGFGSDYIYSVPNPLSPPGHYTVAPGITNGWWGAGCGDHTTGSGNALIADGANGTNGVPAGSNYWCQTVLVEPNTDYALSVWLMNANTSGATSTLGFFINGNQIGAPQTTPLSSCEWNQFYVIWNSGSNTSATLCLSETSGGQPGNDFAVDDISFYKLCEILEAVTVTVSDPQSAISSQTNVSCYGLSDGSAESEVSGGLTPYTYSWNTTPVQVTSVASDLAADTYSVTITDSIGCTAVSSVTITEPAVLTASLVDQSNVTCNGLSDGMAEITATGGTQPYTYSWSTIPVQTTAVAADLQADSYSVTVTDSNNCTSQIIVVITEPQELDVSIIQQSNVTCKNGTDGAVEVIATGGTGPYSYSWNSTPVQTGVSAGNLSAGTYTATVMDDNNCSIDIQAVVTEPELLELELTADQLLVCPNGQVTISAEATGGTVPYSLNWDQGLSGSQWTQTTFVSSTTVYSATVTDINQCTHSASVTVNMVDLPVVDFQGSNLIGCAPLDVTLHNLSTGNIAACEWSFGDGTVLQGCGNTSHTVTNLGCQDVTLTVYTVEGCPNSLTAADFICTEPTPIAQFTSNAGTLSTISTRVDFNNHSQNATDYLWDFGDQYYSSEVNPMHVYSDENAGTYNVMLIASNQVGCRDTAYGVIKIKEEELFYIPNTFTPDGDQFNQTFKPVITSGYDVYHYKLTIYNRWGELIFESRNPEIGWDGISFLTGVQVQDGTYSWKIELKVTGNDDKKVAVGTVNLIR